MRFDEVKAALCQAAAEAGVSEYEIYYMNDTSISCETLKDEISSFNSGVGGGVCFRCIYNGKMGYASSELFEADVFEEISLETCIAKRISAGSTGPQSVKEQIKSVQAFPKNKTQN